MPSNITNVLRREFSITTAISYLLVAAVVIGLTGDVALVIAITTTMLFTELIDLCQIVPSIDERWIKGLLGVLLLTGSAAWLWAGSQQSGAVGRLWLPATGVLGGCWILLDTRADFVQECRFATSDIKSEIDEMDIGEAILIMQHIRLVAEQLKNGPKSLPEIAMRCHLTESQIEQAIELASRDNVIYQVDTDEEPLRYTLNQQKNRPSRGQLAGNKRHLSIGTSVCKATHRTVLRS